jgi:UDP:flavonoid glycosyltransferase YjiC (YdhE family)
VLLLDDAQWADEERLGEAIREVLDHPRYRERAGTIGAEMRGYDAPRTAASLLEDLAQTSAEPVRSPHTRRARVTVAR